MRSGQDDTSPFVDKRIEQEDYEGSSPKVINLQSHLRSRLKPDSPDPGIPPDPGGELSDAASVGQAMADPPSREEIDAKLAVTEARTETRFAEMLGEMRSGFVEIRGELKANNVLLIEEKAGRRVTNSLVIGSALAITALVIAIFALGAQWFNNGIVVRDAAHDAAKEAVELYRRNTQAVPPATVPSQTK